MILGCRRLNLNSVRRRAKSASGGLFKARAAWRCLGNKQQGINQSCQVASDNDNYRAAWGDLADFVRKHPDVFLGRGAS